MSSRRLLSPRIGCFCTAMSGAQHHLDGPNGPVGQELECLIRLGCPISLCGKTLQSTHLRILVRQRQECDTLEVSRDSAHGRFWRVTRELGLSMGDWLIRMVCTALRRVRLREASLQGQLRRSCLNCLETSSWCTATWGRGEWVKYHLSSLQYQYLRRGLSRSMHLVMFITA